MRELDQDPAQNTSIPDDFRGHLLVFAHAYELEYLDMTGIQAEFIYGAAAAAGVGAPANANGDPYSYWMRDWVHLNDRGKQILGREFEIYFAPPPALAISKSHPGGIVLSWPGYATGFALQFTDTLLPFSVWSPLNQNAELLNGRRRVNVALSSAITQQFFRLTKP